MTQEIPSDNLPDHRWLVIWTDDRCNPVVVFCSDPYHARHLADIQGWKLQRPVTVYDRHTVTIVYDNGYPVRSYRQLADGTRRICGAPGIIRY